MDLEENSYEVAAVKWNRKQSERCKLKGPLRVVRLCLLAVLLPGLLVTVPLYLRYRVYSEQLVPLGMSDMRLVDNKISTTWCQRQLVSSNATFNAYLLATKPSVQRSPKFVHMAREIVLDDDMKEYWGFYLLKGSTVTVSSCCRRAGASLIVIKGHHHLRQCAYIGDDSSEEEDELEEIRGKEEQNKQYSVPKLMTRARSDVKFHGNDTGPYGEEYILKKDLDSADQGDDFGLNLMKGHQPKKTKGLTSAELFRAVINKLKSYQDSDKLGDVKKKSKSGIDEKSWMWLRDILDQDSQRASNQIVEGLTSGDGSSKGKSFESSINVLDENEGKQQRHRRLIHAIREQLNAHDEEGNDAEEEGVEHQEVRGTINGTTANDRSNSEFWSSFSSSEERLLECDGLILNQPLIPSAKCHRKGSPEELREASNQQKISYTVSSNGYYFFVYSSENEIETNFVHAEFQLEKMLYNVSNPVAACENSTGICSLPLQFFSHERLILELPVNESLWNSEFLVVSTCEPRTPLYIACIVAVPVLILLCAF